MVNVLYEVLRVEVVTFFFSIMRGPSRSTRTYTLLPCTMLFRSFLRGFVTRAQAVLPRRQRLRLAVDPHGGRPATEFGRIIVRSEEHTSEFQSHMRLSYAVFCLK